MGRPTKAALQAELDVPVLWGNRNWAPMWREPQPKPHYDVVIVGGGGHGLATAYYLAKEFGITKTMKIAGLLMFINDVHSLGLQTAEGLLMYLQPEESLGLIAESAKRFPGGRMMFDSPPALFARLVGRGMRTSLRYRVPPMPFTLSASQAARLVDTIPGIRQVHDVESPATRSRVLNAIMRTAQRFSLFDPVRPAMTLLEFG